MSAHCGIESSQGPYRTGADNNHFLWHDRIYCSWIRIVQETACAVRQRWALAKRHRDLVEISSRGEVIYINAMENDESQIRCNDASKTQTGKRPLRRVPLSSIIT
jgi:hypothetical protein